MNFFIWMWWSFFSYGSFFLSLPVNAQRWNSALWQSQTPSRCVPVKKNEIDRVAVHLNEAGLVCFMRLSSTFLCNYTSCTQHILVRIRLDVVCTATTGKKSHGFRFTFIFFHSTSTAATVFFIHNSFATWVYRCKWYFAYNNKDGFVPLPVKQNECVNNFLNKKVAKRILKIFRAAVYMWPNCDENNEKGYHMLLVCPNIHTHAHTYSLAQTPLHIFLSTHLPLATLNSFDWMPLNGKMLA